MMEAAVQEDLRPVEREADLRACYALMHQLRPHLTSAEEFLARWRRQRDAGYRLLALWQGDRPVALAGYRVQENMIHGRHLYVDDLVTDAEARSAGHGGALMERLKQEARRLGCDRLALDTPMSNARGQRFYFRQGLLATALRFLVTVA